MNRTITLSIGVVLGIGAVSLTAACLPDETPAPVVTDPVVTAERPPLPDDTLACGMDAKPAIDFNDRDGWWAYCEPALIGSDSITLIPCPTEDSDNCYWDAARMGNGQGTSFVTLGGVTYYPAD